MGLPVVAPFAPSWNRMVTVLFRPFDIGRWFVIGFGAFLAQLGEGGNGGGGSFRLPFGAIDKSGGTGLPQPMVDAHAWIEGHWEGILLGAAVILPVFAALWGLLLWLASRGRFIFLDNLLRNRADIAAPWKEFRQEANSLFKWRFGIGILSFLVVWAPLLYGGWRLFDTLVKMREFGPECWILVMLMVGWFIVAFLAVVPFILVLRDFVPVIQWHRRIGAGEAMKAFWREVLPGNFWSLNLYYLWMAVLGLGAALVMMPLSLFFCCCFCLAWIPYLSAAVFAIVFLPIHALFRLYPAYYLAQLGKGWELVEEKGPGAPPPPAAGGVKTNQPAPGQTYTVTGVIAPPPPSSPPPLPPADHDHP